MIASKKPAGLTRPKHWLDFAPFVMAHNPLKMTIDDAKKETFDAWSRSYSPERNMEAINSIREAPIDTRISHLAARLFFRGIYFPQMGNVSMASNSSSTTADRSSASPAKASKPGGHSANSNASSHEPYQNRHT